MKDMHKFVVMGLFVAMVIVIVIKGVTPVEHIQETPPSDTVDGTNTKEPESLDGEEVTNPTVADVTSFDECAAAGNAIMESYPAKCRAGDQLFVQEIVAERPSVEPVVCTDAQKQAQMCTMEYVPVCGLVEVQCVTTPCNPIAQTFGNGCSACAQGNVASYTTGECEASQLQ